MQTFVSYTHPENSNTYRLIIFDEHNSHIMWKLIEFAERHRIECLCLPPHSTHLLQLLDVGIFSPYSTVYLKVIQILLQVKQVT